MRTSKVFILCIMAISFLFIQACSSEEEDLCLNVICENGGTCFDGTCACPDGYIGSNCNEELTPSKIEISNIILTDFPGSNGGGPWDGTNGKPDLYAEILNFNNTSQVFYEDPNTIEDADTNTEYIMTPESPIDVSDVSIQYSLRIYDRDDSSDDDFVGGQKFRSYESGVGFPSEIVIDGTIKVRMEMKYSF